eukprot:jgi/Mesvir1/17526/Mv26492-RA.1
MHMCSMPQDNITRIEHHLSFSLPPLGDVPLPIMSDTIVVRNPTCVGLYSDDATYWEVYLPCQYFTCKIGMGPLFFAVSQASEHQQLTWLRHVGHVQRSMQDLDRQSQDELPKRAVFVDKGLATLLWRECKRLGVLVVLPKNSVKFTIRNVLRSIQHLHAYFLAYDASYDSVSPLPDIRRTLLL